MTFRLRLVPLLLALLCVELAAPPAFAQEMEPDSCLACHGLDASRADAPKGMRLDGGKWKGTAHGESCLPCHMDMEEVPHPAKAEKVDCAMCHDAEAEVYAKSAHGEYLAKHPGLEDAPSCVSCHGTHGILGPKDAASTVNKRNLPDTCGVCHGADSVRGGHGIGASVDDYRRSVHGVELLEKGNTKAASCSDCHSPHELRHRRDPLSQTFKMNIPAMCGRCHTEIASDYRSGIHGEALSLGNMDAPSCTDCHTEHSIRHPSDPESAVYSLEVAKTTCPSCHNVERLVRKFGLAPDMVTAYQDSYHGLVDRQGWKSAANCGSCHGVHRILPAANPASSVAKGNLLRTCAQCHPDAGPGFIEGAVHTRPDRAEANVAFWARAFYWFLIPMVIGGMLLHNGVLVWRFLREKHRRQRAQKRFQRFSRYEVVVHLLLIVSFVTLAVTGFALTYPEAAWVEILRALGMKEPVRAWLHRAAAVILGATSVMHIGYLAFSAHGRYGLRQMLPRRRDLADLIANLSFHLGFRKDPPRFDRYDYTMKAEYWALVWGTGLMMVTGVMLWFKVGTTEYVPRWVVYVAERVHFYEAILAVLAIIVWHFFFVIFHPSEYPMSLTWMSGRVTEEEMRHAHPEEWERLKGTEYEVAAGEEPPAPGASPPA